MRTVKTHPKKGTKINRGDNTFAEMPTFEKIVFREDYILRGHFAFWESIDEIVGVQNLLYGSIVPKQKSYL